MTEKKDNRGGANRGQGRKKSPENLVKVTVRIRQDQKEWELTNEQHRAALDLFKMTAGAVKFLSP